jgi:hypothetical protein
LDFWLQAERLLNQSSRRKSQIPKPRRVPLIQLQEKPRRCGGQNHFNAGDGRWPAVRRVLARKVLDHETFRSGQASGKKRKTKPA